MKSFNKYFDAIIIGSGPVGLVAANLLGQYNIHTLVVEKMLIL
jgi:2-polyprenyl-6-methoxyphenol hydroxylase-like FAD-dependent oxidoreductase